MNLHPDVVTSRTIKKTTKTEITALERVELRFLLLLWF